VQAAMMYDRRPSEMSTALLHMVEWGVPLGFALMVFATQRENVWWPLRAG
jgi:hypothetical protein